MQQTGPRRRNRQAPTQNLGGWQPEERGEVLWDPEEGERDLFSRCRTGIASEPLCREEAVMCPLRSREDGRQCCGRHRSSRRQVDLHTLAAQELHAGAAMLSAGPVLPEQGVRADLERMQQETHPARMPGCVSVPLTLRTLRTGTALSDPSFIDHAQAAIGFSAPLAGK